MENEIAVGMFQLHDGSFVETVDYLKRYTVRSLIAYVDYELQIAFGMCPIQAMVPWAYLPFEAQTEEIVSGRSATKQLSEIAIAQNIELPAVTFCLNYQSESVQRGEAFLPSKQELGLMGPKRRKIVSQWEEMGMNGLDLALLSSSFAPDKGVWMQSFSPNTFSRWSPMTRTAGAVPVIEIKF